MSTRVSRPRSHCRSRLAAALVAAVATWLSGAMLGAQSGTSGTPTLVQSVLTGIEQNPITTLHARFPQVTLSGNAVILGVRYNSAGTITSVSDDAGNTWIAGPQVTASASPYGTTVRTYYVTNALPLTRVDVAISGLTTATSAITQATLSEWYNVALSGAIDGTGTSASSRTTSAFSTTGTNDLVWHWAVDVSDFQYDNGIMFNGTSITAGSGFTLQSADLQTGSGVQYQVKSTAGSITPNFSASGSSTWASVAFALKSAATGTAPPASTMRIVHVQHGMVAWPAHTTPLPLQFPSSGNLLVGLWTSGGGLISRITDSAGNTWASAASTSAVPGYPAQIVYAANATTSPTLGSITTTLSSSCTEHCNMVLYDIVNAGGFDKATTANGNQTANPGTVTMASITPGFANGLVFHTASIGFHTINAAVGAGHMLDSAVNDLNDNNVGSGSAPSFLDMDNAFSHYANANTSPLTFTYGYNNRTDNQGITGWGAVAAAFKPSGVAPSPPTNLRIQ